MHRIRLATDEEVNSIKDKSDLDVGCTVYSLKTQKGTGIAVRRLCIEIDPLVTPEEWDVKLKGMMIRDLETVLEAQGATHYYFNVDAEDTKWQHNVETWGAEKVSAVPMIRYKVTL